MVKEIQDIDVFETEVKSDKLTVVDFFADWCGPCQVIAPKFIELSQANPGVNFLKVNVDKGEVIAEKYAIEAMPTFLFFKGGKKVDGVIGADLKSIESKVKSLQ